MPGLERPQSELGIAGADLDVGRRRCDEIGHSTIVERAQRSQRLRDRSKGRTDQEINRRIDRRYFPGQWRYHAEHDPMSRASVVIDNDDWRQPRIVRRAPGSLPAPIERVLDGMLWA